MDPTPIVRRALDLKEVLARSGRRWGWTTIADPGRVNMPRRTGYFGWAVTRR